MSGCLEHNECMGQIATRMVNIEKHGDMVEGRIDAIEVKLEQVLSTERPPCSKISGLESTVKSHGEQLDKLNTFKDGVIGEIATHNTLLTGVQTDVTVVKDDVKKLIKSDTKRTIYWGIAITIMLMFVNFGVPWIFKKLGG